MRTLLLISSLFVSAQLAAQWDSLRVLFYNQENLFDTIDAPAVIDEEYTPQGGRGWNSYRYWQKSNHMAQAILACGGWSAPDIVGLCEVENREVVEDLIARPALQKQGYAIVHRDSPDKRGIDVALLYKPERLTLLHHHFLVLSDTAADFYTRDILYAKFELGGEELHCFVNHWPSRYGGQQQSEPKRIAAALLLRQTIDSIYGVEAQPKLILMGDFNDSPSNISLHDSLGAGPVQSSQKLVNLMAERAEGEGSHRYNGEWSYLDQMIVSRSLLEAQEGLRAGEAGTCQMPFLLEQDDRYPGLRPKRTFVGFTYKAGFSDHLPISLLLLRPTP